LNAASKHFLSQSELVQLALHFFISRMVKAPNQSKKEQAAAAAVAVRPRRRNLNRISVIS
jgi:hypothetical protein